MAKYCDNCKRSYPDREPFCPRCGPVHEPVEDAEVEVVGADDVVEIVDLDAAAEEQPIELAGEDSVIDLSSLQPVAADSDIPSAIVQLAEEDETSPVAEAAPLSAGGDDDVVDLTNLEGRPIEVGDSAIDLSSLADVTADSGIPSGVVNLSDDDVLLADTPPPAAGGSAIPLGEPVAEVGGSSVSGLPLSGGSGSGSSTSDVALASLLESTDVPPSPSPEQGAPSESFVFRSEAEEGASGLGLAEVSEAEEAPVELTEPVEVHEAEEAPLEFAEPEPLALHDMATEEAPALDLTAEPEEVVEDVEPEVVAEEDESAGLDQPLFPHPSDTPMRTALNEGSSASPLHLEESPSAVNLSGDFTDLVEAASEEEVPVAEVPVASDSAIDLTDAVEEPEEAAVEEVLDLGPGGYELEEPASARDIVAEVESGIDLASEEAPVQDTVAFESPGESAGDSALDLGGLVIEPAAEEAAPASGVPGIFEEEPVAVPESPPGATEESLFDTAALEEATSSPPPGLAAEDDINIDDILQEETATIPEEQEEVQYEHDVQEETVADVDAGAIEEEVTEAPIEEAAEEPLEEEEEAPARRGRGGEAVVTAPPRGRAGAWVGGWFLGVLLSAAAAAAVWYLGLVPPREALPTSAVSGSKGLPTTPSTSTTPPITATPAAPAASLEQARDELQNGNFTRAGQIITELAKQGNPDDPNLLAARGEALWLQSLQELAQQNRPLTREELSKVGNVNQARTDLQKAADANNPDAVFWLGELQQMTDGPAVARQTFTKGMQAFPQQKRFQAALDRLEVENAVQDRAVGAFHWPTRTAAEAYWLATAILVLQPQPEAPGGAAVPPPGGGGGGAPPAPAAGADEGGADEAGGHFWTAIKLAQQQDYEKALAALDEARKVHDANRLKRLRKAQNPFTDPTEKIFLQACDELRAFWQVRAELAKEDALNPKENRHENKEDLLGQVVKAVSQISEERKSATETLAGVQKALEAATIKEPDVAKAVAQLADERKAAAKKLEDLTSALKEAGVTDADLLEGVAKLGKERKVATRKVADVQEVLKAAGLPEGDVADGVAQLDRERKTATRQVTAIQDALKAAGIREATPTQGVEQVISARDKAEGTLDALRQQLVKNHFLPATAGRDDLPGGITRVVDQANNPVVMALGRLVGDVSDRTGQVAGDLLRDLDTQAGLAASRLQVMSLEGELAQRWTPEQMLEVWLSALQARVSKDLTDRGLHDAELVGANKAQPEALCVRALAERDRGKYDDARRDLKELAETPAQTPEASWKAVAERTRQELTDPNAYYLPAVQRLRNAGKLEDALGTLEEALQVFPKDQFAQDNASLLALRGLVRLELLRGKAEGKLTAEQLKDSIQDAADAIAGGEKVEGTYLMGRLAEAEGHLEQAEKAYRETLELFAADSKDADTFRKTHPVSDPEGSRYRAALARVLLEQTRRGPTAPAVEEPARPAEGARGAWLSLPGVLVVDARPQVGSVLNDYVPDAAPSARPEPKTNLVAWGGCSLYALPVLLEEDENPAPMAPVEPPDARLDEVLKLADKLIAAGDNRGYFMRAEALARSHRWAEGLEALRTGLAKALPPEDGKEATWVLGNHPAFQRREGVRPPDPVTAEEYYSAGLREYFDRRYDKAEQNFDDAVYYDDQDARYWYFLALARLAQAGKRDLAVEAIRQGGRLEQQGKPNRYAVSVALERIQGSTRRFLNEVRERAIREATSKPPAQP